MRRQTHAPWINNRRDHHRIVNARLPDDSNTLVLMKHSGRMGFFRIELFMNFAASVIGRRW